MSTTCSTTDDADRLAWSPSETRANVGRLYSRVMSGPDRPAARDELRAFVQRYGRATAETLGRRVGHPEVARIVADRTFPAGYSEKALGRHWRDTVRLTLAALERGPADRTGEASATGPTAQTPTTTPN